MKSFTTSLLCTLCLALTLAACSDETTTVDPGPDAAVAAFTMNTGLVEGDSIKVTNSSTDATTYSWTVMPGGMTSTDENPKFAVTTEGVYTIRLIATGAGGADTTEQSVSVGVSRMFRAFGYGSKTYYVHQLRIAGTPYGDNPCYWDNTMIVSTTDNTFSYNENADVCASPPLLESSGLIDIHGDADSVTLQITDPVLSEITYRISNLTGDTVMLSTVLSNGAPAEFLVVTTPRTQ